MTRSILKAVVCGIIVGALAYFVPHLLIGLIILGFIFRAAHCCMGHGYHGYGHRSERLFYMADRIRKMSDEDYAEFKEKMGGGFNHYHGHGHYHSCCGCNCGCNCGCCSGSGKCDCKTNKETKE